MNDQGNRRQGAWTASILGAAIALSSTAIGSGVALAQDDAANIVYWGWPTVVTRSLDETGTDVLVPRFKDETGIDVEVVLTEQNELGAKLKASLPAGVGPDVLATDFDVIGPYWGFVEDLGPLATAEWGEDWRSNFSAAALDEIDLVAQVAGRPGETLYLPGNMQLLGWVIYSRPLFEQAGVDPAALSTFDDFIAACGQLKEAGITPLAMAQHPAGLVDMYQTLVEIVAPGKMELAQTGQASFADEDISSAFDLIKQVFDECAQEGAIAADRGQVVWPGMFNGDMAMSMQFSGTPWFGFVPDIEGGGADFMANRAGTFLFPGSKGLAATDGGLAIVADSENKDAAWELVKWYVAGQENERIAGRGEPVGWVAHEPQGQGTGFDTEVQAPLIDALANDDNKFRRVLCVDVYNALSQVIPGVVQGQIDSATAGLEVQDAFDRGCQEWVAG